MLTSAVNNNSDVNLKHYRINMFLLGCILKVNLTQRICSLAIGSVYDERTTDLLRTVWRVLDISSNCRTKLIMTLRLVAGSS